MKFEFLQSQLGTSPTVVIPTLGLTLSERLPAKASDNALAIVETMNAPGFGPPLHRHPETEIFRVLEGKYLYEVDGKQSEASAGDLVCVPGGAAHTFVNISDKPSRQFVMILPAFDSLKFFTELGKVLEHGMVSMAALNEFGKPWEMEFLGPPLSARSRV